MNTTELLAAYRSGSGAKLMSAVKALLIEQGQLPSFDNIHLENESGEIEVSVTPQQNLLVNMEGWSQGSITLNPAEAINLARPVLKWAEAVLADATPSARVESGWDDYVLGRDEDPTQAPSRPDS